MKTTGHTVAGILKMSALLFGLMGVFFPNLIEANLFLRVPQITTYYVNIVEDAVDADLDDGICDSNLNVDGDQCSLRAALQEANLADMARVILIDGTYSLTMGELLVTGAVEISNANREAKIDGSSNKASSTFRVKYGAKAVIRRIGISKSQQHGVIVEKGGSLDLQDLTIWESIYNGVHSEGTTIINSCLIHTNKAGGMVNYGTSRLINIYFTQNEGMGGIVNYSAGNLTMEDSSVTSNNGEKEKFGGGITNFGTANMTRGSIVQNLGTLGGGIYNGGTMTLKGIVIRENVASSGGGIANANTMTIINSTIGKNAAGKGGGIFGTCTGLGVCSDLSMNNVTIADNTSRDGGGFASGSTYIGARNTVIAGNTDTDCSGRLTSLGYNHIGAISKCTVVGNMDGNNSGDVGVDEVITYDIIKSIYRPTRGGPAIDGGSPSKDVNDPTACEPKDYFGRDRITRCDIGAVEFVPTCGDGLIDATEECDGANLNNQSCASLGAGSGALACDAGCLLNKSGCRVDEASAGKTEITAGKKEEEKTESEIKKDEDKLNIDEALQTDKKPVEVEEAPRLGSSSAGGCSLIRAPR